MLQAAALGTGTLWNRWLGRGKPRRDPGFSAGDRVSDFLSAAQRCRQDRKLLCHVPSKGKKERRTVKQCFVPKESLVSVPADARHMQPGHDGITVGNRTLPLWHLYKIPGDSGGGYGSPR